jgi:hypothetical protein
MDGAVRRVSFGWTERCVLWECVGGCGRGRRRGRARGGGDGTGTKKRRTEIPREAAIDPTSASPWMISKALALAAK